MELSKLADYHIWANDRVRNLIKKLTQEQYEKEVIPPYNSIQKLILHTILAVEFNLQSRVNGIESDPYALDDKLSEMSINEVCEYWRKVDEELVGFASTHLDLRALFPNFLGEGEIIVGHDDFFIQYLMHSVYHRSQIMSAMRMLGKEGIGTDYLFYISSLYF
jgi:uncharacterized damage-inducible protein DinB